PFPKIIQETLSQQKKWAAETPFIRKNGTTGICRTTASLLNVLHGKPLALIQHQDLTEDKLEAAQLRKAQEKLSDELHASLELLAINSTLLNKSLATCSQLEKQLKESELRFRLLADNA